MVTINATEGSAYGAALLAAAGTGGFSSVEEACRRSIRATDRCEPNPRLTPIYEEYYSIYRSLYANLKDSFRAVSAVRPAD
jgi:xylulokinase